MFLLNRNMTAYILSESSLFVTDRECIIKTCGRTVLLLALPLVLNIIKVEIAILIIIV